MVDLIEELSDMVDSFVEAIPAIIAAIIILIIGYVVAWAAGKIVKRIFKRLRLERYFENTATGKVFKSSGLDSANISCWIVKAFIMILAIILAIQVLDMGGVFGDYLYDIADYLPRLFIGVLVLIVGAFLADFLSSFVGKIVRPMFPSDKVEVADVIKNLLLIGLIAFVILLALNIMLLYGTILYTLVLGFVIIGAGILLTDALIKSVTDDHAEFKEVAGYAKFVLYSIFLIIGAGAIFATFSGVTTIIANISWAFALALGIMLIPVAYALTRKMSRL